MSGARAFQAGLPGERHSMRLARQVAEVGGAERRARHPVDADERTRGASCNGMPEKANAARSFREVTAARTSGRYAGAKRVTMG